MYGLRELSMRRLGAYLGVEGMSLYHYVPSRDHLLDGIVEVVLDDLYGDPEVYLEPKNGWQDYLLRLARGLRRVALARPQIFPLIATRPPQAPWIRPPLRSLRWIDSFLGALCSACFRRDAAVAAYRAFSSFLLGHLLLEVAAKGADNAPVEMPESPRQAPAALDTYPPCAAAGATPLRRPLRGRFRRIAREPPAPYRSRPQLNRTPDTDNGAYEKSPAQACAGLGYGAVRRDRRPFMPLAFGRNRLVAAGVGVRARQGVR